MYNFQYTIMLRYFNTLTRNACLREKPDLFAQALSVFSLSFPKTTFSYNYGFLLHELSFHKAASDWERLFNTSHYQYHSPMSINILVS